MPHVARPDYQSTYDAFDAEAFFEFAGDFESGVNACVECCDRHCGGDRTAVVAIGPDGAEQRLSFDALQARAAQFANALTEMGVRPGDRVSGLLPKIPELLVVVLGTLRAGAVYQPLFTAFGPKAIQQRLEGSDARLIVTDAANRAKLDGLAPCPPIVCLNAEQEDDTDFDALLARQSDRFDPVLRSGDDLMLMMFTSGTTGAPKGVGVPIKALKSFAAYMTWGIGLRTDDVFWNIADPGWAYGLYYAVLGPLLSGCRTTLVDAPFSVEQTVAVIRDQGITNFAAAPTVYRMMIAAGDTVPDAIRGQLRVGSSAGEPLNAEVSRWFQENLGCPLNDHYGQTEVAMVLMNHNGLGHPVRMGSAGRPMPGYVLCVTDESGQPVPQGEPGILAVDREASPLFFFTGYWGREGQDWVGRYYLTGDTVEQGPEGDFSFVGRNDDLISSAGYRIGPFDVESSLIEHPAVLESAVVGKPDAQRGHIVKAFVVLQDGVDPSPELSEALRLHVRNRLGAHAYPREIAFTEALPKTPSGKIQRFLLRDAG